MASHPFLHTWEPSRPRSCSSSIQLSLLIFLQPRYWCSSSQTLEMRGTARSSWPAGAAARSNLHPAELLTSYPVTPKVNPAPLQQPRGHPLHLTLDAWLLPPEQ